MYIFDIDGTLTKENHYPPTGKETLNTAVANTIDRISSQGGKITILTGRSTKYRDITEKWLKDNNVRYDRLIMNNGGSSDSFKKKTVEHLYGINRWYDNSPSVEEIANKLKIPFVKIR